MKVYALVGKPDQYWNLVPVDEEDREFMERDRAFHLNPPQSQAADWSPVRMDVFKGEKGNKLEPDFHEWFGVPVFTERAAQALGDVLTANGELLPLETTEGSWFAYNTLTVLDALDEERSVLARLRESGIVYSVREYVFHPERLLGATIFKIPQTDQVLVTDTLKELVEAAGLRGIRCSPVWPDENQPTVRKSRRK